MPHVAVVGNATKDVNDTGLIASRQPGGTLLYASLALHRLGHEVTPVGYAPLTAYLALRRARIDLGHVELALRPPKFKNTYHDGERDQQAKPGPDRRLDDPGPLAETDAVLLGPVLGEVPGTVEVPDRAVTLLDLQGPVRRLGAPDLWGWREVSEGSPTQALPDVDVATGSLGELATWLGTREPDKAAETLREQTGALGVVTRGRQGAVADDGTTHEARPEPVEADDPTGAGDVFDAGFLHGWLETGDVDEALAWGCGAAAAFLQGSSGVRPDRFPTAEEAADWLPS